MPSSKVTRLVSLLFSVARRLSLIVPGRARRAHRPSAAPQDNYRDNPRHPPPPVSIFCCLTPREETCPIGRMSCLLAPELRGPSKSHRRRPDATKLS
ncbi:hypothetical protein C2E23DRAFT_3916 [Lenzites betulinus]|nr:hypothetical protein C2E23DRAFT_3916 [Lenzites betulinus]